ncbi:MAG: LysR substrate-binding domain-containing protein [Acidimicrobiia bacterium]|nr:LysR substrate-binding domain-containing protein [Acidimicrobiia bacterium]
MELRHLEALLAIEESGSFTAAADALRTVQSNVSEQVRQLEAELGVPLLVRSRRGAVPTEFGAVVLERARRIHRELEALRADLSMLQGLQTGYATIGVVGTISRWLVPALVDDLNDYAPGIRMRVSEGASERLAVDVVGRELAQAVVTEPVEDPRLAVEPLLVEDLIGLVPADADVGEEPVAISALAGLPFIMPPVENPLRSEVERAAATAGVELDVRLEVEGIRLLIDLVAAEQGAAVLPEMAVPDDLVGLRAVRIADMPPRRLALVTAHEAYLSLADQAVGDSIRRLVSR